MISELFASALSVFVLDPIKAELNDRLPSMVQHAEASSAVRDCAANLGPHLLQKAATDYWWAATTVVGVATGLTEPASLLAEGPSACQSALRAIKANEA